MDSDATCLTTQTCNSETSFLLRLARVLHLTPVQLVFFALGSAVGLILTIALVIYLIWKHREKRIKDDVLKLERDRVVAHAGRKARLLTAPLLLFRFCDLSEESCKKAPFKDCRMVSFIDYLAALQIPGGFNWQKAVRTLLVDRNLSILLPATELLPLKRSLVDPFAALGGGPWVYRLLRAAFSPLHLAALGEVINMASIEDNIESNSLHEVSITACMPANRSTRMSCMHAYMLGERSQKLPEDVAALPNTVRLDENLPKLLEGLDPKGPVDTVQPTKSVAWLPDVSFSHVGHALRSNAWEVKCGLVFAVLLNRLSCNMLPHSWQPQHLRGRHTTIHLSSAFPPINTPGELIQRLQEHTGAHFWMQIVSRTASFGLGCAVKQNEEWLQVPLVMPLRTGNEVVLPWNNSPAVQVTHSQWTHAQCIEAADVAALVAGATNHMADTFNLPVGGYAYYGVCLDSVAAIQAALQQPVTMFPCMLSGQPKAQMALAYVELKREVQQVGPCGEYMAALADKARRGLLQVPCDVRHEPATIPDAIRRIQACLPALSPYLTLENARLDLMDAAEQYGSQNELLI